MIQNFDTYRIFYAVAEYENMRLAADALELTPPTVSRAVQSLEQNFGCELFVRTKRGVVLTEAGRLLYARIKPAFGMVNTAEKELAALANMGSSSITVAVGDMVAQYFIIPNVLSRFMRIYPNIKITFRHVSRNQVTELLASGDIDFAVMSANFVDNSPILEEHKIVEMCDVAIVGSAYSFLANREITLKELSQYPAVFVPESFSIYNYYSSIFSSAGAGMNISLCTASMQEQLIGVEAGLGYSFVPEIAAREYIRQSRLFPLRISGDPLQRRNVSIYTTKGLLLSRAAQELIDYIIRYRHELN